MTWIKLRYKLPINSAREVRVAYYRTDGKIRDYDGLTTGEVLNRYVAMFGDHEATPEQAEIVWQYADVAAAN